MAWLYLLGAGLMEIAWVIGLRYSEGWTRLGPSAFTVVAMAISFGLLGLALRDLPLGTAYAVWTGIGSIGAALFGIWILSESADPLRILCIALIVAGVLGLKLVSPH